MIRAAALALALSAIATSYAIAFGLPAGISQLATHISSPPGTCTPLFAFGAPPYRENATPPYRTGC